MQTVGTSCCMRGGSIHCHNIQLECGRCLGADSRAEACQA